MIRKTRIAPIVFVLIAVSAGIAALASCAGSPDAQSTVMAENRMRSYERFRADHAAASKDDVNRAGIHYFGRSYYVVISLTDSGTDRFPEWACDKLLTTLYGYRAVDQTKVSDDEFYELVLKFALEDVIEGKYENLARIRIDERDLESFLEHYQEDF